jgi:hypothetical protein
VAVTHLLYLIDVSKKKKYVAEALAEKNEENFEIFVNCIHVEIKVTLNLGSACFCSLRNLLSGI